MHKFASNILNGCLFQVVGPGKCSTMKGIAVKKVSKTENELISAENTVKWALKAENGQIYKETVLKSFVSPKTEQICTEIAAKLIKPISKPSCSIKTNIHC